MQELANAPVHQAETLDHVNMAVGDTGRMTQQNASDGSAEQCRFAHIGSGGGFHECVGQEIPRGIDLQQSMRGSQRGNRI